MRLYILHEPLSKGQSSEDQTGEHRGGAYAARVQIGVEKDGSPMYKYFKTKEQYENYLKHKATGTRKQSDTNLKQKVSEEHEKSSKKTKKQLGAANLFVKNKKEDKKDDDKAEKSLRLFCKE